MDDFEILDYPQYKEKYPDKSMSEWMEYHHQAVYDWTQKELEANKTELTDEEYQQILTELKAFKAE